MAQTIQKRRIVGNPGKRPGSSASNGRKYSRAKKNPGEILSFALGNPGRKVGRTMAAKTAKKQGYKKAKSNPGNAAHRSKTTKRTYKRNVGGAGQIGSQVTNAIFVILGALGSKLGAQALLGSKNTGLMGYAANAGVGGGLWFVAEKFMKNRAASSGIIAGTIVQILLRAINDYTPFGQYVANLGMGDYQMQSFVTPQVLVDPTNSAEIRIPPGWAPRMIASPASAGSGMSGGSIYSRPNLDSVYA